MRIASHMFSCAVSSLLPPSAPPCLKGVCKLQGQGHQPGIVGQAQPVQFFCRNHMFHSFLRDADVSGISAGIGQNQRSVTKCFPAIHWMEFRFEAREQRGDIQTGAAVRCQGFRDKAPAPGKRQRHNELISKMFFHRGVAVPEPESAAGRMACDRFSGTSAQACFSEYRDAMPVPQFNQYGIAAPSGRGPPFLPFITHMEESERPSAANSGERSAAHSLFAISSGR